MKNCNFIPKDEFAGNYIQLSTDLLKSHQLSLIAKLIYAWGIDKERELPNWHLAKSFLCDELNISKKTCYRALQELEYYGYLVYKKSSSKSSKKVENIHLKSGEIPPLENTKRWRFSTLKGGILSQKGGILTPYTKQLNKTINKTIKKDKKIIPDDFLDEIDIHEILEEPLSPLKADEIYSQVLDIRDNSVKGESLEQKESRYEDKLHSLSPEDKDVILGFMEYRTELLGKKKKLPLSTKIAIVNQAIKISNDPTQNLSEVVERSIAHGWRGLFPIRFLNAPRQNIPRDSIASIVKVYERDTPPVWTHENKAVSDYIEKEIAKKYPEEFVYSEESSRDIVINNHPISHGNNLYYYSKPYIKPNSDIKGGMIDFWDVKDGSLPKKK